MLFWIYNNFGLLFKILFILLKDLEMDVWLFQVKCNSEYKTYLNLKKILFA